MDHAPWKIGYSDKSGPEVITNNKDEAVAKVRWGCSCCQMLTEEFEDMTQEEQSRSRLIASAPELLEACEVLSDALADMHDCKGLMGNPEECLACFAFNSSNVLEIIAKAKGA